jgi:threonine synthase
MYLGDTGPAAIAAVKNCSNLDITVLYPHGRVSNIQELQMITCLNRNVHVYRTEGNTDDQSSVLKEVFNDEEFVKNNNICSINSINWGRIMSQSSYYFWAYLQVSISIIGV